MARNPTGWHPEDIKAALRKRFGTLRAASEAWGLHHTAITNTLKRPMNSMRVERHIADALGVPLHELWPGRWTVAGAPKPRLPGRQSSETANCNKRQKRAAA
ncbi:MAG TPA: helix-turn-helix domain-containing protein [Gammaproteobacteria bacterium]|nr:helix-turn-helix domain-containing protein [Gammaproteobacteria bacterium]